MELIIPKESMKKKTKKVLATLLACTMLGTAVGGATLAYLTDNETATNTVTVGNVDIDIIEPGWPDQNPDDPSDDVNLKVPTEEIVKDPQITNTGSGDAIVFISVEVPKKELTLMNFDGTVNTEPALQEIVNFKLSGDETTELNLNNFNDADEDLPGGGYWIQLSHKEGTDTNTYVFGYNTALGAGETTETLFDKIQIVNYLEGELEPMNGNNIIINGYAIQSENVLEYTNGTEKDLTDNLDKDNLTKIYEIINNQEDAVGGISDSSYTVTFDLGGGWYVPDGGEAASDSHSQNVESGKTVDEPDVFRDNYTFAGWYTDEECTTLYDFSEKVTGAFTLYAGWEYCGITTTFNLKKVESDASNSIHDFLGEQEYTFAILNGNAEQLDVTFDEISVIDKKGDEHSITEQGVFAVPEGEYTVTLGLPTQVIPNTDDLFVYELVPKEDADRYLSISDQNDVIDSTEVVIDNKSYNAYKGGEITFTENGETDVIFINELAEIGSLDITKNTVGDFGAAVFEFYASFDDELLPAGTDYKVLGGDGSEHDAVVTDAGIIKLAAGETARIENILIGTDYVVKELGQDTGDFTTSYSGDGIVTKTDSEGLYVEGVIDNSTEAAFYNRLNSIPGSSFTMSTDYTVAELNELLASLPTAEEMEMKITEYENAEDIETMEAYLYDIIGKCQQADQIYNSLSKEDQAKVTNEERLEELAYMWEGAPYLAEYEYTILIQDETDSPKEKHRITFLRYSDIQTLKVDTTPDFKYATEDDWKKDEPETFDDETGIFTVRPSETFLIRTISIYPGTHALLELFTPEEAAKYDDVLINGIVPNVTDVNIGGVDYKAYYIDASYAPTEYTITNRSTGSSGSKGTVVYSSSLTVTNTKR